MGRVHGKNTNFSFNAIALEGWMNEVAMVADVPEADITSFTDVYQNFLAGKKDVRTEISGPLDMVAAAVEPTLFNAMGGGPLSTILDPTGAGPAANDPQYKCTASGLTGALVESLRLEFPVGGAANYSATIRHSGETTRAVA